MPERMGLCYIKNVPRQLPKGGRVLVHNCVHAEWQDQKPGVNGFRCWTTQTGRHSNMEQCDCGWSGLPHYRIAREGYENPIGRRVVRRTNRYKSKPKWTFLLLRGRRERPRRCSTQQRDELPSPHGSCPQAEITFYHVMGRLQCSAEW